MSAPSKFTAGSAKSFSDWPCIRIGNSKTIEEVFWFRTCAHLHRDADTAVSLDDTRASEVTTQLPNHMI